MTRSTCLLLLLGLVGAAALSSATDTGQLSAADKEEKVLKAPLNEQDWEANYARFMRRLTPDGEQPMEPEETVQLLKKLVQSIPAEKPVSRANVEKLTELFGLIEKTNSDESQCNRDTFRYFNQLLHQYSGFENAKNFVLYEKEKLVEVCQIKLVRMLEESLARISAKDKEDASFLMESIRAAGQEGEELSRPDKGVGEERLMRGVVSYLSAKGLVKGAARKEIIDVFDKTLSSVCDRITSELRSTLEYYTIFGGSKFMLDRTTDHDLGWIKKGKVCGQVDYYKWDIINKLASQPETNK